MLVSDGNNKGKFFILVVISVISFDYFGLIYLPWIYNNEKRCHHCSACNKCVLNMDHHCPWINNCIGITIADIFENILILMSFCLNFALLVMISLFFKFHIGLVLSNGTTIENLDKKRENPTFGIADYDMGCYYNFLQVFGKNKKLWFFPVYFDSGKPVGEGVIWPQKSLG